MDRFATSLKILKDEQGKVFGFYINSAGDGADEHFCAMLHGNLSEGKASVTISDGKICIESIGIGGKEKWSFDLPKDEELQLQKILSGLGKTYQARCKTRGGFGVSFTAKFKEIPSLNKREWGKRRSFWRNPTLPKDKDKFENWGRIHT